MDGTSGGTTSGNGRSQQDYAVVLPCRPDQFSEFIAGLLGRPQTITGRVRGDFEIDRSSIENTYHLIEQRILSQNEGSRISFSLSISYDDATTVTLDSYEDFQSYTEVKPLVVTRVALSWVYLLRFRNRTVPERQQVDIWFTINADDGAYGHDLSFDPINRYESRIDKMLGRQGMTFRVMHTNRTWGNDLEALITSHLRTYLTPPKAVTAWMTSNSGWIGFGSGAVFEISLIAYYLSVLSQQTTTFLERARALSTDTGDGVAQISRKLDLVIDVLANRTISTQSFSAVLYLLFSVIISCFLGFWIGSHAEFPTQSYILINRPSEVRKKRFIEVYANNPIRFALTVIGAIVVGVLGNIAYYYVAKQLLLQ